MSKEQFVEKVMSRLSSEYALSLKALEPHRPAIESAYDTEIAATEEEMDKLFSGDGETEELAKKYPQLNSVSLAIVATLDDEDEDEEEDDDDEDEDEEEDDGDEEEDDDE